DLKQCLRGAETYKKMPGFGALKDLSPREIHLELQHLDSVGLVRTVQLGEKSVLSITDRGRDMLRRSGGSVDTDGEIATYKDLRNRMQTPEARKILKASLRDWFETQTLAVGSPKGWWDSLRMFTSDTFTILDESIKGAELVAHYMKRNY